MMLRGVLVAVLCMLTATRTASAVEQLFAEPATRDVALHGAMRSMMADDDDDDNAVIEGKGGFLQKVQGESEEKTMNEYMQESASSLTSALGSRWNGRELEENAKEKTDALLKGIAGHRALGSLNRLMGAMAAMRG
mmetsp:Transcript_153977/g.271899  ORF Transcript_153977/g.271899 Transcript_153977/m.271899 type:complete len:136 (-) Transcript_153977:76-483(-)